MKYNPEIHHRRSIRLKEYDYATTGGYFVTIRTYDKESLFGRIEEGEMILNDGGKTVEMAWQGVPSHFANVTLDEYVIMPNHFHGIIVIKNEFVGAGLGPPCMKGRHDKKGAASRAPTLGDIVCAFKSISAIQVNRISSRSGQPLWQRNYYERIIRSEDELDRARKYILDNPTKWEMDKENPAHMP